MPPRPSLLPRSPLPRRGRRRRRTLCDPRAWARRPTSTPTLPNSDGRSFRRNCCARRRRRRRRRPKVARNQPPSPNFFRLRQPASRTHMMVTVFCASSGVLRATLPPYVPYHAPGTVLCVHASRADRHAAAAAPTAFLRLTLAAHAGGGDNPGGGRAAAPVAVVHVALDARVRRAPEVCICFRRPFCGWGKGGSQCAGATV
jgi:hypothetical protein